MRLEILCGMIASGKTTFAKIRARQGAIIVNDDSIVNAIHADQYHLYNVKYKPIYKTIETNLIMAGLSQGCDVVIDRICGEAETRKRFIALGKLFGAFVECFMFAKVDPKEHARRRFKSDPRGMSLELWESVAKKHAESYEEPGFEEGFDAISFLRAPVTEARIIEWQKESDLMDKICYE